MKIKLFLLVLVLGIVTACEKDQSVSEETQTTTEEKAVDFEIGEEVEYLEEDGVQDRSYKYYTFHTLNKALNCTGLGDALFSGRKTIYAPSDAAFEKLGLNSHNICDALDAETLSKILLYHVSDRIVKLKEKGCVELLDGNIAQLKRQNHRRFINDSRIYLKWTQKGHGYKLRVYAITDVLSVPMNNIATTAAKSDAFNVLFSAVLAADPSIATALTNEDAIFTVFAPTNQAFVDLLGVFGLSTLEELVGAIGVDNLSKVLLYHVVDGCAFSNNLEDGLQIPTLQGESVEVDLDNLQIIDKTADPSGLIPAALDILTSNGVVHGIDKVLLPQEILDAL